MAPSPAPRDLPVASTAALQPPPCCAPPPWSSRPASPPWPRQARRQPQARLSLPSFSVARLRLLASAKALLSSASDPASRPRAPLHPKTAASAPSCLLRAHLLLHLRRPHRCAMELLPEPSPSANSVAAATSLIFPGAARFQQTAARWLPPCQVPRPARQRTTSTPFELSRPQAPSTTTALEEFGFDKSDDALVQLGCRDRDRQDRLHGNAKYPYARRRQDRFGIHQVPLPLSRISTKTCTTTVAKFDYRTVTPTSSTKRVQLLPLRPVNDYFPRRFSTAPKCTLRRYNPKNGARERNHVLFELLAFASCPTCSSHIVTRFLTMPPHRGNTVTGSTPPFSCVFHTSAQFSLRRYLRELPEPICCRGTIFGFVAMAPLPSAMVTKCFITCSCPRFIKIV